LQPFFSIGVTTYNRPQMLKECLQSIINQSFSDFEVIVGNDFIGKMLTLEELGIDNLRIKIINHPQNLGEMKNMNALLAVSKGVYFSWLADDDMYFPDILKTIYDSLCKHEFPECVYTAYYRGPEFPRENKVHLIMDESLRGSDFLEKFLTKKIDVLGCCGFFKVELIKSLGGMLPLGTSFSPYSDTLLAIKTGTLQKVVYIDSPLIFFRTHEDSISYSSPDVKAYRTAQIDFLNQCILIFNNATLKLKNYYYLQQVINWCMNDYFGVIKRSGNINLLQLFLYNFTLIYFILKLKSDRFKILFNLFDRSYMLFRHFFRNADRP